MIQTLLERGARTDLTAADALMPLHRAAEGGHLTCLQLLSERRVQVWTCVRVMCVQGGCWREDAWKATVYQQLLAEQGSWVCL